MNVIPQRVKDAGVALTAPLARALIQGGVHPNVLTTVGTVILVGSGVTFGVGEIRLGGVLLLVSGLFDILDGQVARQGALGRSEEHTSELQSRLHLVCRLLLEKKKTNSLSIG